MQDKDGFRFISDPAAELTNALELGYDSAGVWGTPRSKRYVLYTENGVVKKVFEEPDNTGVKGRLRFGWGIWTSANGGYSYLGRECPASVVDVQAEAELDKYLGSHLNTCCYSRIE